MAQASESKTDAPQTVWPTSRDSNFKKKKQDVAIKVIELEAQDDSNVDEENPDLILEVQVKKSKIIKKMHYHLKEERKRSPFSKKKKKKERSGDNALVATREYIMPFLAGGSCTDLMRQVSQFQEGFKDENILATILQDVLRGIEYCHKDGRIHRDVKARNILLSETGVALLADFGVSGALVEGGLRKRGRNTLTGTPCWMAPEVMSQQRYNHRADIWSIGITALELAFGKAPYENLQPFKVMMQVMDNEPPTVDDCGKNDFSRAFKSFVSKCLQKDANKRATAKELLASSFFKKAQKHEYIVSNVLKFGTAVKRKPGAPKSVAATKTSVQTVSTSTTNVQQAGNKDKDGESMEFRWSATFSEADAPQQKQQKGRFTVEPVEGMICIL
ncbi:hypothetical protein RFI_08165 [Reticulomyxa filosa]|uniref:Protein kinase domain-containing protein n=1 Tax=Reticulomyxa filosa TaxID=46433 RepID=X6NT96_RETFI|nr:hypothetical protein RFI_08165 [Reticulomyxa filosa]|eukprot:ETO28964.1 hypothetical protein RFI_08165 [Reticulomyxa filosa]